MIHVAPAVSAGVRPSLSLSLHVYEAKNMTQIKNKIRNKTNPSAVARMCTFAELLSVSVRLCAVRLLG